MEAHFHAFTLVLILAFYGTSSCLLGSSPPGTRRPDLLQSRGARQFERGVTAFQMNGSVPHV
jgi:hypothetical protein